ncbi:MAG: pantoate--beta-alanine ligase [Candidatus Omnitrophica bacterium]|nr:pantoate--beta-alanine ligase [Candidatus Omnitrophota bacterium]
MRILRSVKVMQKITTNLRKRGKSIGFVPTMGALHAGHFSLIRQSRKENNYTAVSIFLNPTQFGPNEDYRRYPRNLKADATLCKKTGVDFIFNPARNQIYPKGYKTEIKIDKLSDLLCGKFRPGHFAAVATVVNKLFNIVEPDTAYFGQKDAQQAIIIQRMVKDLYMRLKIKVMPTIREPDGLAMSSRNNYLSASERRDAVVLYNALETAKTMIRQGISNPSKIILTMRKIILKKKSARIQYINIVDLNELKTVEKIQEKVLIALAIWIGKTRLIDNAIITPARN